jgi:hypothetical protein
LEDSWLYTQIGKSQEEAATIVNNTVEETTAKPEQAVKV